MKTISKFIGAASLPLPAFNASEPNQTKPRAQPSAVDSHAQAMAEQAKLPADPIGDRFQGGPFCSAEYDADRKR